MKINNAKSIFHVQRVNFLDYIFIINGVKMDPMKTAIIRD
jgi:hypothetical protein